MNTEAGLKLAESLYHELMAKLTCIEGEIQAAESFDLEKVLDIRQARDMVKVCVIWSVVYPLACFRDVLEA